MVCYGVWHAELAPLKKVVVLHCFVCGGAQAVGTADEALYMKSIVALHDPTFNNSEIDIYAIPG